MKIGTYIILRLLSFVLQIIGGIFVIFVIFNIIPYDPLAFLFWNNPPANEAERIAITRFIRAQWGIDLPLHIQVFQFIRGLVVEGSLGNSWFFGSVNVIIVARVPYTLAIFVVSFVLYTIFSIFMGVFSASRDQTFIDQSIKLFTSLGYGIPYFILAVLGIFYFDGTWLIIDLEDQPLSTRFIDNIQYLILPIIVVFIAFTSYQYRIVRSEMRVILAQNYIRTARAKGLPERLVIYKHGLQNGVTQIITSSTITFPLAITAVVVVETLFQIPGLGFVVINAAGLADWGILIGVSTAFLIFNGFMILVADIITVIINPRFDN